MIKRFGLAGVFAGMVVLACLGIAGCSEDDKDSHVHDYSVVVDHKDADCTEEGYDLKKCSVCGDEKKDNIVSTKGHDYGDWVVDKVADKDHIGKKHRDCNSCGNSESEDDASKFFSHDVYSGATWIADENGKYLSDKDDNIGDGFVNGLECSFNKAARDPNSKYYGRKHRHYNNAEVRKHQVRWDMNGNSTDEDEDDECIDCD